MIGYNICDIVSYGSKVSRWLKFMAIEAFGRQMKIIIGAPQRNIEAYVIDGVVPYATTKVDATTIPAGATINFSNIDPQPRRGFHFKIESTRGGVEGGSANETTTIELANLNQDTLNILHTENSQIQVWLGYESDKSLDLYYSGDIYDIQPKRSGQDIIYLITAKDGFVDNKNTRVSLHYDEGTPVSEVLADLVTKFPSGSIGTLALDRLTTKVVEGGLSFQGNLGKSLDVLCKSHGINYFRFNGKYNLQPYNLINGTPEYALIGRNTYTIPNKGVINLDPIIQNDGKYYDTTNTKRGVQLTTYIVPIELGQFFKILPETSKDLAGTYKTTTIKLHADFKGSDWFVTIRGEPM
ncbi:P2 gpD-like protein [Shewanella sp. phage 1/4]|uniref:baseplate hub n=1 Tax=Shewanella phage 1/4 TaxID=1458859 RepID=UPI0004F78A20|nr:baseplate hub [Shewanella sp. phage 1/4]AHK11269.1 P2 gpD-like protein [Shewanella sp. phage 1/4]